MSAPPDAAAVLAGLKDFQRATVDYVFERLYGDDDPVRRFLIADEVGLGKTMIARGVVARAVEHLWDNDDIERIDIVYVCSNADIARQNINRLTLPGVGAKPIPSRITLLPKTVTTLDRRLNFISITPGTSFNLRSSEGMAEERALVFRLVSDVWEPRGVGSQKALAGDCRLDNFDWWVRQTRGATLDEDLCRRFHKALENATPLRAEYEALADDMRWVRRPKAIDAPLRARRRSVVGQLRRLLAGVCLDALEPDIVILDEFQRFRHLIAPGELEDAGLDDMRQLAQEFMDYRDARVLMLSATPYKMYTLAEEEGDDDHYGDLSQTLGFLMNDKAQTQECMGLLERYGRGLRQVAESGVEHLVPLREQIRERLLKVMVRTERLSVSDDRNGMLVPRECRDLALETRDLMDYVALKDVSDTLGQPEMMEYWKSAPYLLNFMDGYKVKQVFERACEDSRQCKDLAAALDRHGDVLLDREVLRAYGVIDPANPRLRSLLSDMLREPLWRLLWLPPSLPYYRLGGPFADPAARTATKRLVFSSWNVVPKALAALVSYAAERELFQAHEDALENSSKARRRRSALLQFSRSKGRLTGMPLFSWLYPSITLAEIGDPLKLGDGVSAKAALAEAQLRVREVLADLPDGGDAAQPPDERWYWAAPLMLDAVRCRAACEGWLERPALVHPWADGAWAEQAEESGTTAGDGDESEETAFAAHVEEWRRTCIGVVDGTEVLGPQPQDLAEVLAGIAMAGPGVVALRGLCRVLGAGASLRDDAMRTAAASVAWSFRSLLNTPEAMAAIRGVYRKRRRKDSPYWRQVVQYSFEGCLQAVVDEYLHVLREGHGLVNDDPASAAAELARAVGEVLSLRAASLSADDPTVDRANSGVRMERHRMRAHYALRFGDERSDTGQVVARAASVREAFNSPFWPFVLATTSLGQEGLDFHCYCHAVIHWNLPSNPVDLEQREGRVHRYKGHAVRKNVADDYGLPVVRAAATADGSDPWTTLFACAQRDRDPTANDLVPFWVYPSKGGARIERYVPALPLSRDKEQLDALIRSLVVYRAAIGQPRQQDVVEYLLAHIPDDEVRAFVDGLRIDLSPPAVLGDVT